MPGADEVACQHVTDVMRLRSLPEQVVELAGVLTRRTVGHVMSSARGSFELDVDTTAATVTVRVAVRGHDLFDGFAVDPLEGDGSASDASARPAVTWGVRRESARASAWFSVALPSASSAEPVRADSGLAEAARRDREESQPRFRTLVRITEALAAADTLTAVSDGVTGAVRAHLGAAFTGVAVLDPLAAGRIRYVSMDPLPAQTARDWAEIPIQDTSPLGAAVAQARPTYFGSRAAAERSFPGIGQHMRTAGLQSMAHIPLSTGGDPIGVLAVSWAQQHPIDVDQRALLATVAAYTALAVARCREPGLASSAPTSPADSGAGGTAAGGTAAGGTAAGGTAESGPAAGAPSTAPGAARPLRVLLVDDTADIRELLTGLFARRPDVRVVAEARDGQEAVQLAAALQPDIIVLDVAMPVLDGISALPLLVAAAPHARIVMLSALPAGLRATVALATGATAYVEKTTQVATLVDDLLEGAKLLDVAVRHLTEQVDHQLDADPRHIKLARHLVADTLQRWQQSPAADTIVLLLSELVTNAILHARSAPRVSVRLLPDRVHVEVTDDDPHTAHALPLTRDRYSGRGLAIIESLALNWGTALLPGGKVVWFDVARGST